MKHIKLFEKFIEKYEQIKELPEIGAFNISDLNMIDCAVNALEKIKYTKAGEEYEDNFKSITWWITKEKVKDLKGGKTITYMRIENHYNLYDTLVTKNDEFVYDELLDFNDYFIPKHEFRGLNLKNKFGL